MAYKVVTHKLQSCLHVSHGQCVQYSDDWWITPKYPAFVFVKLHDAVEWARHWAPKCEIWRCRTKNLRPIRYVLNFFRLGMPDRAENLRIFWEEILEELEMGLLVRIPEGEFPFHIADSVKLTARVR